MSLQVDVLVSETGTCQKCSKPLRRGEIVFIVEGRRLGSGTRRAAMVCGDCGGVEIEKLKAIGRTPYNSEEQMAASRDYREGHDEIIAKSIAEAPTPRTGR